MQENTVEVPRVVSGPVVGYWWTGEAHGREQQRLFVVRVGFFEGDVVDLVNEVIARSRELHDPVIRSAFDVPDVEVVRNWQNASEMLAHASEMLNEELPVLLPLPFGSGILYVAADVSAEQWNQLRALARRRAA